MRILYVSEAVLPSPSANSIAIISMCHGMAEASHEVELVAVNGTDNQSSDIYKYYAVEPMENLKITLIPKKTKRKLQQIAILNYVRKVMKNVDIVYTRWNHAARLANLLHAKTIIEYHKMVTKKKQHKMVNRIIQSKYTQKVVFITHSLRKEFETTYGKFEKYTVEAGAAQKPSALVESSKLTLECGYMGSFYKGKGVETVLQVAEKLPAVRFHIVGGSQHEITEMKQKYHVTDNVIWYGYRPYSETMELAQNFGIALLPNQDSVKVGGADIGKYTSPNKMFEYMAQGKVVIASDIPVLREVLQNGRNAMLVNVENSQEWAEAIMTVIHDEKLRISISRKAKEDIYNKYNWCDRACRILEKI